MRWEKYGWQLSKITNIFTNRATPRMFKKFNTHYLGRRQQGASKAQCCELWPWVRCLLQLMDNRIALNGVSRAGDLSANYTPCRP